MANPPSLSLLLVDDEPLGLSALERAFRHLPVRVMRAHSAEEALEHIEAHGPPDCVITDYRMDGMDGVTLLERLATRYPWVHGLLFTGEAWLRAGGDLGFPVISRPCPPEVLVEWVGDKVTARWLTAARRRPAGYVLGAA